VCADRRRKGKFPKQLAGYCRQNRHRLILDDGTPTEYFTEYNHRLKSGRISTAVRCRGCTNEAQRRLSVKFKDSGRTRVGCVLKGCRRFIIREPGDDSSYLCLTHSRSVPHDFRMLARKLGKDLWDYYHPTFKRERLAALTPREARR
jgi:hypothetical protein